MMGHKIGLCGEMWLIIPKLSVTPSYLDHWEEINPPCSSLSGFWSF